MWVYKCEQKVSEGNIIVPEQRSQIMFFLQVVLSTSPPARTETTAELQPLAGQEGQAFFLPTASNHNSIHGSPWQCLYLSLQSSSGICLCLVQTLTPCISCPDIRIRQMLFHQQALDMKHLGKGQKHKESNRKNAKSWGSVCFVCAIAFVLKRNLFFFDYLDL